MKSCIVWRLAIVFSLCASSVAAFGSVWTSTVLDMSPNLISHADSASNGRVYGYVGPNAVSWDVSTGVAFNHGLGRIHGSRGGEAVGETNANAAIWNGLTTSSSSIQPSGAITSAAYGTDGNQQVGSARFGSSDVAGLWSGTAASFVNLSPSGASTSTAVAVDSGTQVGFAVFSGITKAGYWTGSASSWHALSTTFSNATGVSGYEIVGYEIAGVPQARLWNKSLGTTTSLHPAGATFSVATAVHDGIQVGWQRGSNSLSRATLWTGSAASVIDLHQYVPAGVTESVATSVFVEPTRIVVAGYGNVNGVERAMVWTQPVPEPGTMIALSAGLVALVRRKKL